MGSDEFRELKDRLPFKPFELALSDGPVCIRHPEQAYLARRHVIIGLAQVKNGRKRPATPTNDERTVKDWLLLDLIHVVSAEPDTGKRTPKPRRTQ